MVIVSTIAVRLPKNYRFQGKEVYIKKLGNAVILLPKKENLWQIFEEGRRSFSDDFMQERNQPEIQTRPDF